MPALICEPARRDPYYDGVLLKSGPRGEGLVWEVRGGGGGGGERGRCFQGEGLRGGAGFSSLFSLLFLHFYNGAAYPVVLPLVALRPPSLVFMSWSLYRTLFAWRCAPPPTAIWLGKRGPHNVDTAPPNAAPRHHSPCRSHDHPLHSTRGRQHGGHHWQPPLESHVRQMAAGVAVGTQLAELKGKTCWCDERSCRPTRAHVGKAATGGVFVCECMDAIVRALASR